MDQAKMDALKDQAEAETAAGIEAAVVTEEQAYETMTGQAPEAAGLDPSAMVPMVRQATSGVFNAIAKRRKWEPL